MRFGLLILVTFFISLGCQKDPIKDILFPASIVATTDTIEYVSEHESISERIGVRVLNKFNQPIQDIIVHFDNKDGGAVLDKSTMPTDSIGTAHINVSVNSPVLDIKVTASIDQLTQKVTFHFKPSGSK